MAFVLETPESRDNRLREQSLISEKVRGRFNAADDANVMHDLRSYVKSLTAERSSKTLFASDRRPHIYHATMRRFELMIERNFSRGEKEMHVGEVDEKQQEDEQQERRRFKVCVVGTKSGSDSQRVG